MPEGLIGTWVAFGTLLLGMLGVMFRFNSMQKQEVERRTRLTDKVNDIERRQNERHTESEERNRRFYQKLDEIKENQHDLKVSMESFRSEMKTELKHIGVSKDE